MATKPNVIIGMPATDIVRAKTAKAIACVVIASEGVITDFILHQSCELASARTTIVNEAIKRGGTHLLFWDTDICPINTGEGMFNVVGKLLAHNKPIVGVEYNKRKFPLETVYSSHHKEWEDKRSTTELYNAQFAGTGFMLIDLAIFKDPKFGVGIDGKKTAWFNFGRDSQGSLALGEDAWFCFTARDSGYETWIDPTIKIAHIGEYSY